MKMTAMEVPVRLTDLGFDPWFVERWAALGQPEPVGRAWRLDRGWCTVLLAPEGQAPEPIRARTYGQVAVGDWVVLDADGDKVEHVLERRSAFVRRASYEGARAQDGAASLARMMPRS